VNKNNNNDDFENNEFFSSGSDEDNTETGDDFNISNDNSDDTPDDDFEDSSENDFDDFDDDFTDDFDDDFDNDFYNEQSSFVSPSKDSESITVKRSKNKFTRIFQKALKACHNHRHYTYLCSCGTFPLRAVHNFGQHYNEKRLHRQFVRRRTFIR
jgi:hypothetical protein